MTKVQHIDLLTCHRKDLAWFIYPASFLGGHNMEQICMTQKLLCGDKALRLDAN